MNFWQAVRSGFANYVTFQGRAIRSEYWFWVLFTVLGGLVTETLDAGIFTAQIPAASPLNGIFDLITFLPSLALSVRRLHDIDRTGWWVLIAFSVIGIFVLIYWACKEGTPGSNRFGGDPFAALAQITQRPTA
jgi:uncharacterized membrane protein YhaH (DUF805 family)